MWFSDDGRTWTDSDLPALDAPLAVATTARAGWQSAVQGTTSRPRRAYIPLPTGTKWTEVETESPPTIDAVSEYLGTAHFVGSDETWLPRRPKEEIDAMGFDHNGRSWPKSIPR